MGGQMKTIAAGSETYLSKSGKNPNKPLKLHANIYPIPVALNALLRHIEEKHCQLVAAGDVLLPWLLCQKGVGTSLKSLQPVGDPHWSRGNREESCRHDYMWSGRKLWNISQQKGMTGHRTRKSYWAEHLGAWYHPHLVGWTLMDWTQLTENIQKVEAAERGDRYISACIIACGFFSLSTFKSMIRHFCLLVMSQIHFPNSRLFCLWECIKKEKWHLIINGSITEEGITKSNSWKMCASQIQVGKGRAAQTVINQDYKQKHAGLLLCKILKPRSDRRKSQVGFKELHVSSLWYRRHLSGSW